MDFLLHDFSRAGKFDAVKTHVGVVPKNFRLLNDQYQLITPLIDCAISMGSFRVLRRAAGTALCQRVGNVCRRLVCHITEILACDLCDAPNKGACEEKDYV